MQNYIPGIVEISLIRDEEIGTVLKEIDDHIRKEYLESRPKEKRDWRTHEQAEAERIREAMKEINPLIHEAVSAIRIAPGPGRPQTLDLELKVKLLLVKQLLGKSNREFAYLLGVISLFSGIEVSYKTIERLYSDELVMMALHNLHILLLKKKGIKQSDATGDGTGYSLTIKKNYKSYARELSELLGADYDEILYYVNLLLKAPAVYCEGAESDGLVIRDHSGNVVPIHPRMAISNLYKIALMKNPEVREHRDRIDEIIAKLISLSTR